MNFRWCALPKVELILINHSELDTSSTSNRVWLIPMMFYLQLIHFKSWGLKLKLSPNNHKVNFRISYYTRLTQNKRWKKSNMQCPGSHDNKAERTVESFLKIFHHWWSLVKAVPCCGVRKRCWHNDALFLLSFLSFAVFFAAVRYFVVH